MEKLRRRFTNGINCKKKLKLTKLHVDEDPYREARHAVQNLIRRKKAYFQEKLTASTANLKKP